MKDELQSLCVFQISTGAQFRFQVQNKEVNKARMNAEKTQCIRMDETSITTN